MGKPLIELANVTKTFDTTRALDAVDLVVESGEVLALLGCNGSGKSTLARILSGEIEADSGQVLYHGQPATHELLREKTAYSPQTLQMFENMSVLENLRLGGTGLPAHLLRNRKQDEKAAQDLLQTLGLHIPLSRTAGQISYAEKYLLQFGRVLGRQSDVIILDEITAALTVPEVERIHHILAKMKDRGTAIIYITHNMDEAIQMADRVAVLRDGRLEWLGKTAEAEKQDLGPIMFGETRAKHYPKLPVRIGRPILEATHLTTAFVHDISLQLHASEIIGIAGVAGSGRTRILRALGGLDPALSGTLTLDDTSLRAADGPYRGIGYLPDERDADALFLNWGTGNNISIQSLAAGAPFAKFGIDSAKENLMTRDLIERLGISGAVPETPITALSNGNKQKAVISRCISSKCRIYLFDEPTQAIDAAGKVEIYNIINRLLAIGAGIIMVSSDITELSSMCDRLLFVRKGSIIADISSSESAFHGTLNLLYNPERNAGD